MRPSTIPSHSASSMNEMTLLPMSFTVEPCPISPQWMAFVPMAIITGRSSSWTAASPPVMKRSVPFSAPFFEPVTGASSASAPRSRSAACTRRVVSGLTVEHSR